MDVLTRHGDGALGAIVIGHDAAAAGLIAHGTAPRRRGHRLGGKWKGVALYRLLEGIKRYNELKRDVGNVSQRMLTKQLQDLEEDGLIVRTVYPVVPPHLECSLSKKGGTLAPILPDLRDWGESCVQGERPAAGR